MRWRSWPRCRHRPGWSTAGCSAPATTRSIGGRSPVPPRNLELAAGDPAGAPRAPRRRDDFSLAATGRPVAGPAPDAAGHAAGSHRQVTPGPGRWLVFGVARLLLAFQAVLGHMETTTGRLAPRLAGYADVNGLHMYYEV